jgi:hypothetical protein
MNCPNCNAKTAQNRLLNISGTDYCPECRPEHIPCFGCNSLFLDNDLTEIDGEYYCEMCRDEEFGFCQHCENLVALDDLQEFDGDYYCESCFDDNFGCCDGCSKTFCNDDLRYHQGQDGCYCENCYPQDNENIHDHDYKPRLTFYKSEKDTKNPLFFGIELEVESYGSDYDCIVGHLPDWTYAKEDSSINNGFEIVTMPFSWLWYNEHLNEFSAMLGRLRSKKFSSYETSTCGIHIHLSKTAFSTLHFFRFLTFFYLNEENKSFILKISQRLRDQMNQWSSLWDTQTKDLVYKVKDGNDFGRYTAVNTQNKNTYEVRIFKGTLNLKSFCKNVEFCQAVYKWTLELGEVSLLESLKSLTIENFVDYVKRERKEYPNLLDFMVKRKLCAL